MQKSQPAVRCEKLVRKSCDLRNIFPSGRKSSSRGTRRREYDSGGRRSNLTYCGLHVMDDCILPPSSNFQYSEEDWNSNKFIPSTEQKDNFKTCDRYNGQKRTGNENNDNKEFMRGKSSPSATSPTSIFATSLHRKDLSYDDLSKNIDANLAEIDMETFRSEDINSILALPAIYSGDFQSASHGEQCASVSGSLLNALELDSSIGPRNLEDDISISKDEPLFSPLRDPPIPDSTISVDSLDNSSVYDHDLVLTCKANKNNYTIVFEGSGTQFSDESDYQDVCGNSEGDRSLSSAAQNHHSNCCGGKGNSMIQSDLVFTTWSKLRRTLRSTKKKNYPSADVSVKSQSLPNLSHHSIFINDKQLAQWLTKRGNRCMPVYDVQSDRPSTVQVTLGKECSNSVSLLKLFMKHKAPTSNSLGSSTHSDSTSSALVHPSNYPGNSSENSLSISNNRTEEDSEEEESSSVLNSCATKFVEPQNNEAKKIPIIVDNIKILDWNSVQNLKEANNNTINSFHSTDNNNLPLLNNWKQETQIITNSECDNSQYFEDSLVEVPVPPLKIFHTMPIKEEEETDVSSGDEIMKDNQSHSESNKCLGEVVTVQNNEVNCISRSPRQDWSNNLDRINNIFPTSKSNVHQANENCSEEEKLASKKVGFTHGNQSLSTQTKLCNGNESADLEDPGVTTKSSSNQTDSDTLNNACYSLSRDSSPTSSGYVSSRHSSVERLRRSSQSIANTNGSTTSMKRSNVVLATTRSCSTQIPVHVKDAVMQTSAFSPSNANAEFTLKDSSDSNSEQENVIYASSKSRSQDSTESSEKAEQKDKKAIYVCYPNYSLPDLSFLKSSLGDDSVFLTPTKYILPQEVINKEKLSRPKSYAGFETLSEKYLTHIKDWESLNVLLPDDLKQLFSKIQPEDSKNAEGDKCKSSPTPTSSVSSSGDVSTSNSSDTNCKKHSPRSILRKSSSVGHCEEKSYHIYPPSRCPSDTSVGCKMNFDADKLQKRLDSEIHDCKTLHHTPKEKFSHVDKPSSPKPNRQEPSSVQAMPNNVVRTIGSRSCPKNEVTTKITYSPAEIKGPHGSDACSFKSDDSNHKNIRVESSATTDNFKPAICQCCKDHSQRVSRRLFTINSDVSAVQPESTEDYKYSNVFMYSNFKQGDVPVQQIVNKDHKDVQFDMFSGKKAVKFSERDPQMKLNCADGYSQGIHEVKPHYEGTQIPLQTEEYCSSRRLQPYEVFDLDSESPPQEFAVSPTQGSPNLSPASDFYFPRNSTNGGSKLFQEALKKKTGLVENLQKATEMITEHCRVNYIKKNLSQISSNAASSAGQKILASLCPAVHTILSDGLLPTVQGFFGPVPNSPWKVAEASVQQGEIRKDVQDLLNLVNSEKLLTDSTYRFNAFIIGLLNLGCLDWWIGHLCTCQSLICHHYHPTALLSLLALPAAAHLRQELKEIVSPLSSLPFSLDLAFETKAVSGECWSVNGHLRRGPDECVKHEVRMCGRSTVSPRNKEDKRLDLNFPFSPYRVEENEFSFKAVNKPIDLLPQTKCITNANNPKNNSIDECQDQQVWPGVTINPFPNARIMDDVSENHNACYQPRGLDNSKGINVISRSKSSRSVTNTPRGFCVEELNKGQDNRQLAIPELSLCSSTDSGCSSQADHQTLPSKKAADVASSDKEGKGKEVQQFRKLRQQWEKIMLGDEKPQSSRNPVPKQPALKTVVQNQNKIRKKTSESPKTLTPPSSATRGGILINHSRRVVSQSPIGRKTLTHHPVTLREGRQQAPDVVASSQVPAHPSDPVKKLKSQIPLPKAGKNMAPKSLIPVQKAGTRTRSAH